MTTALRPPTASGRPEPAAPAADIAGAGAAIFVERAWPAALPVLAPLFLLVVASLFGVWRALPALVHAVALAAAIGAALYAAWRCGRSVRWPARAEALARMEADSRLAHAPLQALEDQPFGGVESGLWRAHLADMRARADGARASGPRPVDARDPYALRYGAVGLLVVALVAAGPDRGARFIDAFRPRIGWSGNAALADLWIEPPAYTGKAPIYLLKSGEKLAGLREQVDAPKGSIAVAQVAAQRFALRLTTESETVEGAKDERGRATLQLARSGLLRLKIGRKEGRFPIGVAADEAPSAYFLEDPATTDDARLALAFIAEDDYGIASVRLRMRLDPDQDRPLDSPAFDDAALGAARSVEIAGLGGPSGERRADADLQSDPWAGLGVIASLVVADAAGQEGASEEARFRLPARPFFNPLARVVVEQRQTLAVAADDWRRAGRSLDALTLAPDRFYESSSDFLLMRTAFWRVMRQDGEGFAKTVEDFWPLALQLEDEALELARRQLEAAREKLRQALENNASDDDIARLVEDLRNAMRRYLEALANSGERISESGGEAGETFDENDLNAMLDSIRDLSQSGARNAARQALSDLERLLDNMRLSGQGSGRGGSGKGQSGGLAGEAGDLIGRQRDLADRSFERGQSPGAAADDLALEEGGLAEDVRKLLDGLAGVRDADPQGAGAAALGEALSAMRDAEKALGAGDFAAAGAAMETAIARLRDGAEALAEAQGAAERERVGESGGQGVDPLGRPFGEAYGRGVEVPEEWDAQRARDVLQELRRRLSQGDRNEDEIRYLERLLERF
jgi:uncharacterized protein (TIGR02302 family)